MNIDDFVFQEKDKISKKKNNFRKSMFLIVQRGIIALWAIAYGSALLVINLEVEVTNFKIYNLIKIWRKKITALLFYVRNI